MKCPLCNRTDYTTSTIVLNDLRRKSRIASCRNCGLWFLLDLKKSRAQVYTENYSVWGQDEQSEEKLVESSKKVHFAYILSLLNKKFPLKNKTLLDIGTGKGYLLEVAKTMGVKNCYGLELSKFAARIAEKKFPKRIFNCAIGDIHTNTKFDIITLTDLVEHLPKIRSDFKKIHSLLKPGGVLLITTPNTDSLTRKIRPQQWFQYKFEHVIYFNKKSMRYMLQGYDVIALRNNTKKLKAGYYRLYLKKYSSPVTRALFPRVVDNVSLKNPFLGELFVIAKKTK